MGHNLEGIVAPLATPFKDDESLDKAWLRQLAVHILEYARLSPSCLGTWHDALIIIAKEAMHMPGLPVGPAQRSIRALSGANQENSA